MTVSIDSSASGCPPRRGLAVFECVGAQARAQHRHLATVVTISGSIEPENLDRLHEYSKRFLLPDKPFVLDLRGVQSFAPQAVTLLHRIDDDCRAVSVEWALVANPLICGVLRLVNEDAAFPTAGSVHEALHDFADSITARRNLLLPLLSKTA